MTTTGCSCEKNSGSGNSSKLPPNTSAGSYSLPVQEGNSGSSSVPQVTQGVITEMNIENKEYDYSEWIQTAPDPDTFFFIDKKWVEENLNSKDNPISNTAWYDPNFPDTRIIYRGAAPIESALDAVKTKVDLIANTGGDVEWGRFRAANIRDGYYYKRADVSKSIDGIEENCKIQVFFSYLGSEPFISIAYIDGTDGTDTGSTMSEDTFWKMTSSFTDVFQPQD